MNYDVFLMIRAGWITGLDDVPERYARGDSDE